MGKGTNKREGTGHPRNYMKLSLLVPGHEEEAGEKEVDVLQAEDWCH